MIDEQAQEVQEDVEISHIHTTCRNCVFAKFEKDRQKGCSLDKIKDYKEAGIEVLEVFDESHKEFYLINGRFCLFYRTQELMKDYPRSSWEDIARMTTKCPYQAIIFFEKGSTLLQLKDILHNLKTQEVVPNMVTVINQQYIDFVKDPENNIQPSSILEAIQDQEFYQYSCKNVYDDSLSDRSWIDLVFDSTGDLSYPFYVVFRSSFKVPEDFSKELNDAILIKMMQVGFGKPVDDLNGMIVNRTAHKKHGGNAFGIHLEDKIEKFEANGTNFICEAKEICPCLE
jgi:hypothetical protein